MPVTARFEAPGDASRLAGDAAATGPARARPTSFGLGTGQPAFAKLIGAEQRIERDGSDYDEGAVSRSVEAKAAAREAVAATGNTAYRDRFEAVAEATVGNPNAGLALAAFVQDARIPLETRQQTVGALARLAKEPMAPGVDRERLIQELVQEVANPAVINQRNRNTCAPTTVQMMLAAEDPAHYVELVGGLAADAPLGTARMRNGEPLPRVPGSEDRRRADEEGDLRTQSSRLFQSAAMEYANGEAGYDLIDDLNFDAETGKALNAGLNGPAHARLAAAMVDGELTNTGQSDFMTHRDLDALSSAPEGEKDAVRAGVHQRTKPAMFEAVKRALQSDPNGRPVAVSMDWPDGAGGSGAYQGHKLLVTAIGEHDVEVRNPQGYHQRIPTDAFIAHLDGATLPAWAWKAP